MNKQTKMRLKTLALGFSALVPLCLMGSAQAAGAAPSGDVLLQADEAVYDSDKQFVTAKGHVEIDYDGHILLADAVSYDQKSDLVTADGHVSLLDADGNVAFANHATLTDHMRDGALTGFGALLGKNGRLAAVSARRTDGRFTEATQVAYTPCKICNKPGQRTPVWQVTAVRIVHDQDKHRLKFKDATISVLGVPLLYSPYLSKPDPSVRYSSGLLTPDIGSSTSIGYFLRLPYYFSLSPSRDVTIEPLLTTNGGDLLLGEFRQRWDNSGMWLQGSFGENPNGGQSGEQSQFYAHLFGSGRFALSPAWQAGFDTQVTSNDTYLKRYDISRLDRLISDFFVVGRAAKPLCRDRLFLPRPARQRRQPDIPLSAAVDRIYLHPERQMAGGQFRLDVNSVTLSRDLGTNDQRFSAETRWRLPIVASDGELWTLQLDARGDLYHTDTPMPLPSDSHYVARGLPYIALDWRWPFIAKGGNGQRSLLVEPIAQFIMAPYIGNSVNIPNEDSLNLEIDDNNIFSFDQVPGL